MAHTVTTHLMFEGTAEQAMRLYVNLFPGAEIRSLERYAAGEGPESQVKSATFALAGQHFICIDSPVKHQFTFTPSMSLYVECEDLEEVERIFAGLADGGAVLMPLDNYGFSSRFGWVQDRFGVSWQLNLK